MRWLTLRVVRMRTGPIAWRCDPFPVCREQNGACRTRLGFVFPALIVLFVFASAFLVGFFVLVLSTARVAPGWKATLYYNQHLHQPHATPL